MPTFAAIARLNGGSPASSGGLPSVSRNEMNSQVLAAVQERIIPTIVKQTASNL